LLWRCLRRLNVAGAWLGAALWALHPVQVESAAWITEQKNTQSCLFYLLAILFFLRWREASAAPMPPTYRFPRARRYAAALLCATLAILSKSSTVMLPVVLALCWWWMDGGWRWRNTILLVPFLTVSAVAAAWTVWQQKYASTPSSGVDAILARTGRDRRQGRLVYLWKLAWPRPLTSFITVGTQTPRTYRYLPLVGLVCALLVLWLARNGSLRPAFFAAAYFVISLFPVLDFFNVYSSVTPLSAIISNTASIGPLASPGAIAWACKFAGGEKGLVYPVVSAR